MTTLEDSYPVYGNYSELIAYWDAGTIFHRVLQSSAHSLDLCVLVLYLIIRHYPNTDSIYQFTFNIPNMMSRLICTRPNTRGLRNELFSQFQKMITVCSVSKWGLISPAWVVLRREWIINIGILIRASDFDWLCFPTSSKLWWRLPFCSFIFI